MPPKSKRIPKRFTRAWVRDNPELFKELSTPPEECPVCLQTMQDPQSPLLDDFPTSCRHFSCRKCWLDLFHRGPREWKCPVCREPLRDWMAHLIGATVQVERFDKQSVILFVSSAIRRIADGQRGGAEMDPLLFHLGMRILKDADSSEED